jgi:hypothetical protein
MHERDLAFYRAWATLVEWLRDEAAARPDLEFVKQADFPDYIYRMERPYDLPTIHMSVSLSRPGGQPILLVSASPRHTVFKGVQLHPFGTHVHRTLRLAPDGTSLAEGPRVFTREMLTALVDRLAHEPAAPA